MGDPLRPVEVVVAGGGPTGLATAALLDAAGVRVEVFERKHGPSTHAKGFTMHPRTLEVLDVLDGVSDALVARGRTVPHAHFAALPNMVDYTGLPTPYPFVLMVPQSCTERVLADHLSRRGVRVRYGYPVTGFEQHADGVRVQVDDTVHEAGHLVAADGARSALRQQAGIAFAGTLPTAVGFGADVELADPPDGPGHRWHPDAGWAGIVPLPGGIWRIYGMEPTATGLSPEQARARLTAPLHLGELRASVRRVVSTDFGLHSPRRLFRYSNASLLADRLRAERLLLVGDAAHVNLPAGGQGLNAGLQDAACLAWRLAAEIQGWAGERVTGFGYERERRHVAELLRANTLAQDAIMNTFGAAGAALRELVGGFLTRGAGELIGLMSGLGVRYPALPGAHPLSGTRVPNLMVDGEPVWRVLRPDRFLLLDLSGRDAFGALEARRVDVAAAPSWSGLSAVLVRPDGYVAHASSSDDVDEMVTAITAWTAWSEQR
ncbi:monooxygenase [Lentzea roselyniae]|uniref:Monooxygenase n=1 Tax=Lentzea roselyniae TaxID=531940 RepID=A0ABP7AY56_9PSEU